MRKKGISPLIATVLIIGFTVALAAVMMTWGMDFIKSMQDRSERLTEMKLVCSKLTQELDIKRSCVEASSITVMITNSGTQDVESFNFLVEGEEGRDFLQNYTGIPKAGIKHYMLPFKPKITGLPTKIKATPSTIIDGKKDFCEFSVEHKVNECTYGITRGVWGTLYEAKDKDLYTLCISEVYDCVAGGEVPESMFEEFWVEGLGGGQALNLGKKYKDINNNEKSVRLNAARSPEMDLHDYSQLSLEAWVKLNSHNEPYAVVLWDGGAERKARIMVDHNIPGYGPNMEISTCPSGTCVGPQPLVRGTCDYNNKPQTVLSLLGQPILSVGEWHHLVGVYYHSGIQGESGYLKYYIDGQLTGEKATNIWIVCNPIAPFKIGPIDGLIDSAVIYNRSLSAEEVLAHYNYKKQFI